MKGWRSRSRRPKTYRHDGEHLAAARGVLAVEVGLGDLRYESRIPSGEVVECERGVAGSGLPRVS